MMQSRIKRRFAATILITFVALLVVATASILYDMRIGGMAHFGRTALLPQAFTVDRPITLSASPGLTVKAGKLSVEQAAADARVLSLVDAVIDVSLTGQKVQTGATLASASALEPLIEQLANAGFDKLILRRGTVRFVVAGRKATDVTAVDAEINVRNSLPASIGAAFKYLGQDIRLEAQFGKTPTRTPDEQTGHTRTRLPLQATVKAAYLSATFEGEVEAAGALALTGQTHVHTTDLALLADALGHGWANRGAGPAVVIKGPLRWAEGVISFGKSQVSLGDQEAVGAVTLAMRDGRPAVESTLAFQALDVAPLLQRAVVSTRAPWRAISTAFPALSLIDGELRLSASRLQWNGTPVGKGAITVSARAGMVHGDLAEFNLGPHSGSLQAKIDMNVPGGLVSLRGKFDSTDLGPSLAQLFGAKLASGPATTQFEVMGRGKTLGDVLDGGYGRGIVEMHDGQMQLDLFAVQKLTQAPANTELPSSWGAIGQQSGMDGLDAKFVVRDGVLLFEQVNIRSKGLLAVAKGQVGLHNEDLDMSVRLGAVPAATGLPRGSKPPQAALRGPALSVRGPWATPLLAVYDADPPLP
jgi:hypothetical protein